MKNQYVLPKTVIPEKYYLTLSPNLEKMDFFGEESIEIKILRDVNKISLNSNELTIISALVIQNQNINAEKINYDKETQTVILSFGKKIKKGKAVLNIKFKGMINESMRGFYKSIYVLPDGNKKIMATTQFEPNDARRAFPCFDEPELKARFSITIRIQKELSSVSNMPVKAEKINDDIKEIIFEESPLMSTYLIAFVIGEFECLEGKTKDKTIVRIITTPGKKLQGKFALDVSIKTLEYYNNYFKIPYPLPKLDLIAIPDFESGAMENWGLITYRETALLIDDKNSSATTKQRVSLVVSHEIAHQWFGNLVTMKWWNDLWLNEGFASWIEYKPIDKMFPEWDLWTQFFYLDTMSAFSLDSLQSSHKIEVEVLNPNELSEIFDAISYSKGASVIRMLEQYLGEETFRKGLQNYLSKFKYGNAKTDDLWTSLEKMSKKPVRKIMNTWTKQVGYPLVSINSKKNKFQLKQERFLYLKKSDRALWSIPIAAYSNKKIKYYEMNKKTIETEKFDCINSSQVGFYRVKYDDELLKNITRMISAKELNAIDRIGIENNVYALSRGSYSKLNNFFELLPSYKNEQDYTIWLDISSNLSQIKFFFPDIKEIDDIIINIFSDIYKKIGWNVQKSHKEILLRSVVLTTLGLSNNEKVLEEAKKRFDIYLKTKELDPDLKLAVYFMVAYSGSKEQYEQLKNLYIESNLQEEKIRLLSSLGKFRQKEVITEFLNFILSDNVRYQDVTIAILSVANNYYGLDLTWKFFMDNYKEFERRFDHGHSMSNIIKSICSKFSSDKKLNEVEKFFSENKPKSAKRAIEQSLELIKINCNFVKNNEKTLQEWLKTHQNIFK